MLVGANAACIRLLQGFESEGDLNALRLRLYFTRFTFKAGNVLSLLIPA